MKFMTSDEIRDLWLEFFKDKGHYVEPSASLIPHNDPTLLWINSGVAALKKYFDGTEQPKHRRITNSQKAIRTNDIENVGKTARHHTFFEMLGNFSIGDYFREEVIPWAVDLLTSPKYFGFPLEKLYITHHPDDQASRDLWIKCGVDPSHLIPLASNFWEVGPGPCGPDTEIYFDRGEDFDPTRVGIDLLRNDIDNDRYVEIWNIVFSQYNAEPNKARHEYKELPQKNIDTGCGFERLVSIIQGAKTNFDTDLFLPYIQYLASKAAYPYEGEHRYSYQVIVDHIRSLVFALSDGAFFANEGRGYVLKKLVRRMVRQATILKIDPNCLCELVDLVADNMNHFYPYLQEKKERVKKMIAPEINKFVQVLENGEKRVLAALKNVETTLDGDIAFTLSDTYGIPYDLTEEIALAQGKSIDKEGYQKALEAQKERARKMRTDESSFGTQSQDLINFTKPSTFIYEEKDIESTVIGLFKNGVRVDELDDEGDIILSTTTFYALSGGQVADIGFLKNDETEAQVTEVIKATNKQFLHHVNVLYGRIKEGDTLKLEPDYKRRHEIMKNHSSAHLLQKALQEVLGEEVHQEGSFVSDDEMRFDFSYEKKISSEEVHRIEKRVNEIIAKDIKRVTNVMNKEEALKTGAMALFNEKYDDEVRVVSFGDYSKEFCGGTHVDTTKDIQHFVITSCGAIAAGIKRITALTGIAAYQYRSEEEEQLEEIAKLLKVNSRKEIYNKLVSLKNQQGESEKRLQDLQERITSVYTKTLMGSKVEINGLDIYSALFEDLNHEQLNEMVQGTRARPNAVVFVVAKRDGKSEFAVGLSVEAKARGLKAGDLVKKVALTLGGSGGGREDIAFGGTTDTSHYKEALDKITEIIA